MKFLQRLLFILLGIVALALVVAFSINKAIDNDISTGLTNLKKVLELQI